MSLKFGVVVGYGLKSTISKISVSNLLLGGVRGIFHFLGKFINDFGGSWGLRGRGYLYKFLLFLFLIILSFNLNKNFYIGA